MTTRGCSTPVEVRETSPENGNHFARIDLVFPVDQHKKRERIVQGLQTMKMFNLYQQLRHLEEFKSYINMLVYVDVKALIVTKMSD